VTALAGAIICNVQQPTIHIELPDPIYCAAAQAQYVRHTCRLHQLLHEAKFKDPDGAHLSPAGLRPFCSLDRLLAK
jgi:hypothetical protein